MKRGSTTVFVPGKPFSITKKRSAILKRSLMCVECHNYRVKGKDFQEEGDVCRYCRNPRKGKYKKKLSGKQKIE